MMSKSSALMLSAIACLLVDHLPARAQETTEAPVPATASPQTREWSLHVDVARPGDDLFWDKGAGATFKYTVMQTKSRGFALSAGIQNWSVNEEIGLVGGDIGGGVVLAYASQLKGVAQLIPLSAAGVFRHQLSPKLDLNLEAGLIYILVNSNVEYDEAIGLASGGRSVIDSYTSDVDIDNGLLAVIAADLRYKHVPSSKWTWLAGVGYQADISKGDVSYPATPITGAATGESELKALSFRFGLASAF